MTRVDRTKDYASPRRQDNWDGEACDKQNLTRWSEWVSANSKVAPRARGGEMRLPDTGGDVKLTDTGGKPKGPKT